GGQGRFQVDEAVLPGEATVQGDQAPDRVQLAARADVAGEPADRLVAVGTGPVAEVVGVKIVGRCRRGLFAGHHVVEVMGEGRPAAEHGGETAQFQPVVVPRAGGRARVYQGQGGGLVLHDRLV